MTRSGEFDLIKKLTSRISSTGQNLIVDVGDDCAVVRLGGKYVLATVDAQVDDVHFLSKKTPPERIGHKAIASALSDIAAMGGMPTHCLVSLLIPKGLPEAFLVKVYAGITKSCRAYGVSIVGGNVTRARQFAIDICMLGDVEQKRMLLRSGAKAGDKVLVTGSLGDAAAGLNLLQKPRTAIPKITRDVLIARQISPTPRIAESVVIARMRRATAMIDISDGLAQDALHIARQGKVGITLYEEKLPLSRELEIFCAATNTNASELALAGGEDYELLFTVPPSYADTVRKRVEKETRTNVSEIGKITKKESGNWLILRDSQKRRLTPGGWNHLRV